MILHGGILVTPVFLTDRRETSAFNVPETASITPQELTGRPHFGVALFWGVRWAGYARDPAKVRTLQPAQAEQEGRVYLARRHAEAPVFEYRKGAPDARTVRRVSPTGIGVLQQYHIPIVAGVR